MADQLAAMRQVFRMDPRNADLIEQAEQTIRDLMAERDEARNECQSWASSSLSHAREINTKLKAAEAGHKEVLEAAAMDCLQNMGQLHDQNETLSAQLEALTTMYISDLSRAVGLLEGLGAEDQYLQRRLDTLIGELREKDDD